VCSTTKIDLVRALGADHTIDYTQEDFADGQRHYDLIRWIDGYDRQLRAQVLSPFISQNLRPLLSSENHQDLLTLTDLIQSGKVTPVIDRSYPLTDAPKAIQYLTDGHARGKVVITV
jgi:NADPH:quinone reductase-like Zn-dependent oxidoreductase